MQQRQALLADAAALVCPREHRLPDASSSLDTEWRLAVFDALKSGNATYYNVCNLGEVLTASKVFTSAEKGAMSDSVIIAGALRPPQRNAVQMAEFGEQWNRYKCDVIIKASFPRLYRSVPSGLIDGLDAEVMLYDFLTQLVRERVTPNLVTALGDFECTFRQLAENQTPQAILRPLLSETTRVYAANGIEPQDDDSVRLLVLERGRGTSLASLLEQRQLSEAQLVSLLAQILYTLDALNERHVRHGDLHMGNVFVDRLSDKSTLINYVPNPGQSSRYLAVPTFGLVAKLYDWDWGGVYAAEEVRQRWPRPPRSIVNAVAVSNCRETSACGNNPKADVFTLLSAVYDALMQSGQAKQMPNVVQFLRDVIDPRLLAYASPLSPSNFDRSGGFMYRLCGGALADVCSPPEVDIRTGRGCSDPQGWRPDDCYIRPTFAMLQHPLFASFLRDYTEQEFIGPYVFGDWPSQKVAEETFTIAASMQED